MSVCVKDLASNGFEEVSLEGLAYTFIYILSILNEIKMAPSTAVVNDES